MARYAEGTKVPVENSRGEITGILARYGVQRMGWQTSPEGDELLFELKGRNYRFSITKPTLAEVKQIYRHLYAPQVDWTTKTDAEWRRRWRANVLLIKAKLEFADGGDTSIEREFMPYLVVNGRQTLAEFIESDSGAQLLEAGH